MESERTVVRTDEHISARVDGEEVLLHTESETYFGLNEVGTLLWESLQEPRTVDELITQVREEFDVSEERTRKDIESFVEDLEAADLIETSDGSSG